MKVRKIRSKSESGFMSTKAVLASGILLATTLGGAAVYANIMTPAAVNSLNSPNGSSFCVNASWSDDASISAQKGDCGVGDVIIPGDETDDEAGSTSLLGTHTCGPANLKITQAMIDFSKSNQSLKDAGKSDEMEEYPGGGWKIIVDATTLGATRGAFLTTDGEFDGSLENLRNDSGFAMEMTVGETCDIRKFKDGKMHADGEPAVIQKLDDGMKESWLQGGSTHRDQLPAITIYNLDGSVRSHAWFMDGESGKDRNFPQSRVYDESGAVVELTLIDPNTDSFISSRTVWIGNGHSAESWDKWLN